MNNDFKRAKYYLLSVIIILVIVVGYCIYVIGNLKRDINDYNTYVTDRSDNIISSVHAELINNRNLLGAINRTQKITESEYIQLSNNFLYISKAHSDLFHLAKITDKKHDAEMNNFSSKIAQDISLYLQQHQNETIYSDEVIKKISHVNEEWNSLFEGNYSSSELTIKLSSSAKILAPNPTVSLFNQ